MIDCLKVCGEWVRRYRAGETPREIAVGSGASAQGVTLHLARHGALEGRSLRSGHECNARCEDIASTYAAGDSLGKIALRHRVTRERIRQIVRAHDIPVRAPSSAGGSGHACNRVCDAIKAAAVDGVVRSFTKIADEFGVAGGTVANRARLHGIKTVGNVHSCGDRCRALIAYLAEHPDSTTFSAGSALGIPPTWIGMRFKANHPDHNRTRKYFTEHGRRITAALASEARA